MCLLSLCRLLSINVRLDPFAEEMKSEAEKIWVFPEVPRPRSQPRQMHKRRSTERLGSEITPITHHTIQIIHPWRIRGSKKTTSQHYGFSLHLFYDFISIDV
jgi:hypothetical protein